MEANNLYDRYYEEETGFVDDKLTVSSHGFIVITDVLEDLFEQFGFVRFSDKNNLEAVTEFDAKLETVFSETRIDLVQAFNEAMQRLEKNN